MEYVEIFSCLFYTLFNCHVVVYVCSRDLCLQDADIKTSSVGLLALYCKQVPHTQSVCFLPQSSSACRESLHPRFFQVSISTAQTSVVSACSDDNVNIRIFWKREDATGDFSPYMCTQGRCHSKDDSVC